MVKVAKDFSIHDLILLNKCIDLANRRVLIYERQWYQKLFGEQWEAEWAAR